MSEDDIEPVHPPRRRINGATWVYVGAYFLDCNGIVGRWKYATGQEIDQAGYAMGCVKDDRDSRETRFCPIGRTA